MEHDATSITNVVIEVWEKNGLLETLAGYVELVRNFNGRSIGDVTKFWNENKDLVLTVFQSA